MINILVLTLSAKIALCISPDVSHMAVPMKQFNEYCGYEACPVPMSTDGINVHIVPSTHYELAFQRTFAEHYTGKDPKLGTSAVNMKRTLDYVITELYRNRHRRFTLSDFPYFFHWWSQRDQGVRQMVYTLIRNGQLSFIGGGWGMPDEATTNYHAIIDSFTYTLRKINATFLECGRPLASWQADVMGHSREFASLMAQMGYDSHFINPISFDDELARMKRWALELLWRGSDDLGPQSDIFTHKLFDGYWSPPGFCFSSLCADPLIVTSDSTFRNVEQRAKEFIDMIYFRQAPNYNSSHVMVVMGHLLAYFDAPIWFANIDALIQAVNTYADKPPKKMYLMYSTPACYAKAVRDQELPLETKQDDFYPFAYDKESYLTGLFTSFPSIKLMAREVMVYLQMCKQMRVLAELGHKYNKMFEELHWIMGVFQDHTIITGAMKDEIKGYYVEKLHTAVQRSTLLLKDAWNKLRKSPDDTFYYRCSFNMSRCHQLVGNDYFVMIYNPLAWPVSLPVRMPMQCFGTGFLVFDPKGNLIKSATMRIPIPVLNLHNRVNVSNCEVVFIARNIPPIGYKSYFIQRTGTRRSRANTQNSDSESDKANRRKRSDSKSDKNTSRNLKSDSERDQKVNRQKRSDSKREKKAIRPTKSDYEIKSVSKRYQKINIKTRSDSARHKTVNRQTSSDPARDKKTNRQTKSDSKRNNKVSKANRPKTNSEINKKTRLHSKKDKKDTKANREARDSDRDKRTLIKNIRKNNKKYLTRQVHPFIEDQSLLYDLDYDDYNTTASTSKNKPKNVSMLVVSDDELQNMQSLNEDDDTERKLEEINQGTNSFDNENDFTAEKDERSYEMSDGDQKGDEMSDSAKNMSTEKMQAHKWNKVVLKSIFPKKKIKNFGNKVNVTPKRTTKASYDLEEIAKPTPTEKVMSGEIQSKSNESIEDNSNSKENGLRDLAITLLEHSLDVSTDASSSNESTESINLTTEPDIIPTTTQTYTEASIDETETDRNLQESTTEGISDEDIETENTNDVQSTVTPIDLPKRRQFVPQTDRPTDVKPQKETPKPIKDVGEKNRETDEHKITDIPKKQKDVQNQDMYVKNKPIETTKEVPLQGPDIPNQRNDEPYQHENEINTQTDVPKRTSIASQLADAQNHRFEVPNERKGIMNQLLDVPNEPKSQVSDTDGEEEDASSSDDDTDDAAANGTAKLSFSEIQEDLRRQMNNFVYNDDAGNHSFIENKYIKVEIDQVTKKVAGVTLSNGLYIALDIQLYWYPSDDPVALNKKKRKRPGAYLFRAMENTAIPIIDYVDTRVYKTSVVEEAHIMYADWASFVIRVYDESPVIEVEWMVGPVPVGDKLGKEVFIRYLTNLIHDGVFYTDSNGRQTIKRIRNMRPTYDSLNHDHVAGNYYPVTSKIFIEDLTSDIRFTVFNDRSQGGTSLADGEIDLMIKRRILTEDTNVGTFVNDTENGKGSVARGKHYLYVSKASYKPYRIFEKKFVKEITLGPQMLVSRPDPHGAEAKKTWFGSVNEMTFLNKKLPIGIHLLTLEHWNGDTILIRLENYLEKSDSRSNGKKVVYLRELLTNIYITSVKEMTLGGNIWLEDYKPVTWNKQENFVKSFNDFYGADMDVEFLKHEKPFAYEEADLDAGITLKPQQIRTFVCWYEYVDFE